MERPYYGDDFVSNNMLDPRDKYPWIISESGNNYLLNGSVVEYSDPAAPANPATQNTGMPAKVRSKTEDSPSYYLAVDGLELFVQLVPGKDGAPPNLIIKECVQDETSLSPDQKHEQERRRKLNEIGYTLSLIGIGGIPVTLPGNVPPTLMTSSTITRDQVDLSDVLQEIQLSDNIRKTDHALAQTKVKHRQPAASSDPQKENCARTAVVKKQTLKKRVQQAKLKRNKGKAYTSPKTGQKVSKRCSKELTACRLKCKQRISDPVRLSLFNEYWTLGTYSARVDYMYNRIERTSKKSTKIPEMEKPQAAEGKKQPQRERKCSFKYRLFVENTTTVYVCKVCFRNVYGENNGFLRNVKEIITDGKAKGDKRGKIRKPKEETPEWICKKDHAIAHIRFVLATGAEQKLNVSEKLNLSRMHDQYKQTTTDPVSYSLYRRIYEDHKKVQV